MEPIEAAPAGPAAPEPMSAVDRAWLRMDEPGNLMMIHGVLLFAGELGLAELRR